MSLLSIFQWLQQTDFATALRESALVYPTVMATHLTGMALFGGMIFLTDLRILGIAMRGTPVSDVVKQFRPWKHFGLLLVATCGIMLAWSKAEYYYHNPFFWLSSLCWRWSACTPLPFARVFTTTPLSSTARRSCPPTLR